MLYPTTSTRMTSTLTATALVLFLTHGSLGIEDANKKTIVNVDLYYEALCGDSVAFVKGQLSPAYDELQDHLKINFIPYGKATHEYDNKTGRWNFECQHGPAECKGNRDQACALDAIEKNEKFEARQKLSVKLVGCVMSSRNPATAVTACGENVGLSEATKEYVANCQNTPAADDLLVKYGEKTLALGGALTFVPTILVNGENLPDARSHFERVICDLIPQDEKPSKCKSS